MPGRNHPVAAHEREQLAGAMPALPAIAEVEQEPLSMVAILVKHDGPLTVYRLPARRSATFTVNAPLISALNGSTGRQLGVELKRSRAVITSSDYPFLYTTRQGGFSSASSVPAAALWPALVPLVLENADQVFLACAGVGTVPSSSSTTITGASGTFAAAGAGSVALPGATNALTGFDIDTGAATSAGTLVITVSNVTGGPYTYDLAVTTASGSQLQVRFPNALPASGGAPAVAVGALVGGPAGSINVYGTNTTTTGGGTPSSSTLGVVVESWAD